MRNVTLYETLIITMESLLVSQIVADDVRRQGGLRKTETGPIRVGGKKMRTKHNGMPHVPHKIALNGVHNGFIVLF